MTKDKGVRPFCTLYKLDHLHSYSLYGHRWWMLYPWWRRSCISIYWVPLLSALSVLKSLESDSSTCPDNLYAALRLQFLHFALFLHPGWEEHLESVQEGGEPRVEQRQVLRWWFEIVWYADRARFHFRFDWIVIAFFLNFFWHSQFSSCSPVPKIKQGNSNSNFIFFSFRDLLQVNVFHYNTTNMNLLMSIQYFTSIEYHSLKR